MAHKSVAKLVRDLVSFLDDAEKKHDSFVDNYERTENAREKMAERQEELEDRVSEIDRFASSEIMPSLNMAIMEIGTLSFDDPDNNIGKIRDARKELKSAIDILQKEIDFQRGANDNSAELAA